MRLPLATLEVFDAIARAGTMRGAADRLGVQPSTVSHQLKALEAQLGTVLFVRTTRSVSLTEAGRALLRGAAPAFDQLSEAVESARSTGHAARGTLKLAMPEFAYHLLVAPALHSFCEAYPEIELELSLTDALSDILGEELHAGIRLGDRIAEDMVAVQLSPELALTVVGSPEYFARNGRPQKPEDLLGHSCIRYRFQSSGRLAPWRFTGEAGEYDVDVKGALIGNSLPALLDLAQRGLGLVNTFSDLCTERTQSGQLLSVLDSDLPRVPGMYLYFPREYRDMM
ncbi:MAG: LysR family transcriptional regulator, partial [Pseudomonadota bacterium]